MKLTDRQTFIIALCGILLLFGIIGTVIYESQANQLVARRWVIHTYEVIDSLKDIDAELSAAEAEHDAFLVTHDSAYKQAIDHHAARIESYLDQLQRVTKDNEDQQRRIAEFQPLIKQRIDALRSNSHMESSKQLMTADRAKIRLLFDAMQITERRLLDARTERLQNTTDRQVITVSILMAGSVLLIICAAWLIWNSNRQRTELLEKSRSSERTKTQAVERLQAVLDSIGEGIYEIDTDGLIRYINPNGALMLGLQPDDLIGKSAHATFHHQAQDGKPTSAETCEIYRVTQDGRTRASNSDLFVKRDGQLLPVQWVASPLMQEGEQLGAVVSFMDISARTEAEKRVSEFYAIISHEMRTPLTSIRGSLGLLEGTMASTLTDKALRLVAIAKSETDRLIRLINDILDLKKLDAGKFELRLSQITVDELITKSIDGMRGFAATQEVGIVSEVRNCGRRLVVDEDRVIQVLCNLLSNAIKFSDKHKLVSVSVQDNINGDVRFEIKDEGPGIPADQIAKLFAKFQQLDSSDSRPKGGSGLGLSISKGIVEQHGGRIGVSSKEGSGSTFWFELRSEESISVSPPRNPSSDEVTILLIEDDEATREVLKQQLSELPVSFLEAADGRDAIQLAVQHIPDLIILDVGLPSSDGYQVLNAIREKGISSTPMIVYTCSDLTQDDMQQLQLGPTKHLIKARTEDGEILAAASELLAEVISSKQTKQTKKTTAINR